MTVHDEPAKAKLFQHGRSQAVRLPKEFRFEGTEVFVRRVGDEVVLSSRPKASMRELIRALDDFERGVQIERAQPSSPEEREPVLPKPHR
jgi:antitoxin VapB